jgi:hypothetical protein
LKPEAFDLNKGKMAVKKKESKTNAQTGEQKDEHAPEAENASAENAPRELSAPVWSVVSFERCEASGLTYREAEQKLNALEEQKVSGLCIVTDDAAARISAKNQA